MMTALAHSSKKQLQLQLFLVSVLRVKNYFVVLFFWFLLSWYHSLPRAVLDPFFA